MAHGPGSTGATNAERINEIISKWDSGSSAEWQTLWNNRATVADDVELPYTIAYGHADSSVGWWGYIKDLNSSTHNTSSGGGQGILGLPSPAYRNFISDLSDINAIQDGSSDGDQGRRVYQFLIHATRADDYKRSGSPEREILCAWAGTGSSSPGSSAD